MATNLILSPVSMHGSYENVGVVNNVVADFKAVVDGKLDTNAGNYTAQIDWGDGKGFRPGEVVRKGQTSSSPFQIKGSYAYDEIGTYRISVLVTGRGGRDFDDTATHTVRQLPGAQVATAPPATKSAGKQVDLVIHTLSTIHTYAGVGFEMNEVAGFHGLLNGQINERRDDYSAFVHWGDGSGWSNAKIGTTTDGPMLVKGSHVYAKAGQYRVVTFLQGPDGTSLSVDTVTVVVSNMPNGLPGDKPNTAAPAMEPSAVDLNLYSRNGITAYARKPVYDIHVADFSGVLNYQPLAGAENYTAYVNWGDSPYWQQAEIRAVAGYASRLEVHGFHRYWDPGVYRVSVYLQGPDGTSISDDTTSVYVKPQADLITRVNTDRIVATRNPSVALRSLVAGQSINVPVIVENYGTAAASGAVRVSVYVSTQPNLGGTKYLLKSQSVTINLAPGARQQMTLTCTVPTGLPRGEQFYVLAKATTTAFAELFTSNNTSKASRTYAVA